MDAHDVITTLGLAQHPEGGYYRQTWADVTGSAIYYLLADHEQSAWHRVRGRTEVWHFYAGSPLLLSVSDTLPADDAARTTVLGPDLQAGERPQAVVPADAWQRARTTGIWSLVGCSVSPAFSFDAFELA